MLYRSRMKRRSSTLSDNQRSAVGNVTRVFSLMGDFQIFSEDVHNNIMQTKRNLQKLLEAYNLKAKILQESLEDPDLPQEDLLIEGTNEFQKDAKSLLRLVDLISQNLEDAEDARKILENKSKVLNQKYSKLKLELHK